jgi:hypothetical protein
MPAAAPDEVVLASYYDLSLTGLESLKFTNVQGLQHSVQINSQAVATTTGANADARTVGRPETIQLSMDHVVLTSTDVWKWMDDTISSRAGATSKKAGTLSLKELGTGALVKTWRLDDVYLSGISLGDIGSGSSQYLTATVTVLVGTCTPM